jgi:hypothetical protein
MNVPGMLPIENVRYFVADLDGRPFARAFTETREAQVRRTNRGRRHNR